MISLTGNPKLNLDHVYTRAEICAVIPGKKTVTAAELTALIKKIPADATILDISYKVEQSDNTENGAIAISYSVSHDMNADCMVFTARGANIHGINDPITTPCYGPAEVAVHTHVHKTGVRDMATIAQDAPTHMVNTKVGTVPSHVTD